MRTTGRIVDTLAVTAAVVLDLTTIKACRYELAATIAHSLQAGAMPVA
jgi:hypothetical protein